MRLVSDVIAAIDVGETHSRKNKQNEHTRNGETERHVPVAVELNKSAALLRTSP